MSVSGSRSRRLRRRHWFVVRLWRRCSPTWWLKADMLYRAHRALCGLRSAAVNHLTLPSGTREEAVRSAYDASVFYCSRIEDTDVRELALYATYQCAKALSPVAGLYAEGRTALGAEIGDAVDTARKAMLEYSGELDGRW